MESSTISEKKWWKIRFIPESEDGEKITSVIASLVNLPNGQVRNNKFYKLWIKIWRTYHTWSLHLCNPIILIPKADKDIITKEYYRTTSLNNLDAKNFTDNLSKLNLTVYATHYGLESSCGLGNAPMCVVSSSLRPQLHWLFLSF